MAKDDEPASKATPTGDEPTVVVESGAPEASGSSSGLWSDHGSASGEDARARVSDALSGVRGGASEEKSDPAPTGRKARAAEKASQAAEKAAAAADKASEAKDRASDKASEAKAAAGAAASDVRGKASSFASSARERAGNTDVKDLAAHTSNLIDTARPFFLAAFATAFTILGFLEGDSGAAQWFVAGAIIFVIGAAFSVELDSLLTRRERDDD